MSTKIFHNFVRNPNLRSEITNRYGNRHDPFNNTLTVLEDPQHQRKLFLIGTTNSSTTLAQRTKKLLNEVKPDSVYVQTCPTWWKYAKHTNVETQQLFSDISKSFEKENYRFENNLRGVLFRARYYLWMFMVNEMLRLPNDFKPFTPGLETCFALKYAQNNGAQIIYGGRQFDPITIEALRLQPDMYPWSVYKNFSKRFNLASIARLEFSDFLNTLDVRGGEAFAQSIDRFRANMSVSFLSKAAPKQKKVLIDQRDERIFRDLYNLKAKNVVAVVNQWHAHGVETHWRRATKTEILEPELSPVHDMPIDKYQEQALINDYLREFTSKTAKTEPATWQDYLFGYHKENYEYERTRHTYHDSHEDIPEPGQEKKHNHH